MIAGIFHQGSGLGNQLFRFIGTRTLADQYIDQCHGMIALELFKGKDFMTLPITNAELEYIIESNTGKVVIENLKDVTVIDGEFQSEKEWDIERVREWIKVEPLDIPDDVCVINFRGGEYKVFPDLYLPRVYWASAIDDMLKINSHMKFEIHTDDIEAAEEMVGCLLPPSTPIIHDIGINWRSLRYAKYAIISNSSFAIIPRLLSGGVTIAPKFWAGHNKGYWQEPMNYYKSFKYI